MIALMMNPFISDANRLEYDPPQKEPWGLHQQQHQHITTNMAPGPAPGSQSTNTPQDHHPHLLSASENRRQDVVNPSTQTTTRQSSEYDLLPMDIICTRNNALQKNPGNHKYNALILEHREAYQTSTQKDVKSTLTRKVLKMVQDFGGRFVKYDDTIQGWIEIDEESRREKVSHALRSTLDPKKRRRSRNSGTASQSSSSVNSKDGTTAKPRRRASRRMSDEDYLKSDPAFRKVYERQQEIFQQMRRERDDDEEEEEASQAPAAPQAAPLTAVQRPEYQQYQQQQQQHQPLPYYPSQQQLAGFNNMDAMHIQNFNNSLMGMHAMTNLSQLNDTNGGLLDEDPLPLRHVLLGQFQQQQGGQLEQQQYQNVDHFNGVNSNDQQQQQYEDVDSSLSDVFDED